MKRKRIIMAMAAGLCALASNVAAPVRAAETCTWRGTAPICDGECEPGERYVTNRETGADLLLPSPDSKIVNAYGEGCVTGSKALCCKAVAEPAPPAAPPPAATEREKGPIEAPSRVEGTELEKGPIVAPAPAPPPPVPAGGQTATVIADVDVYGAAGGGGNVKGVLRSNNKTTKVSIVEPCQNNWFHVKGDAVPDQEGWVYSGKGGDDYKSLDAEPCQ